MFKIIKKGSGNFWHNFNNGSKEVNLSDWEIVLDSVNQTVSLQMLNGANVPSNSVIISDVVVIDETDSSIEETFSNVSNLRDRLIELQYTPYMIYDGLIVSLISTDPDNAIELGTDGKLWSGGGGGSVGTLQQVTDNGNTTTNDITAGGFLSLGNANIPGINFNDAEDLDTSLGFLGAAPSITTPRNWVLPDTSGTIALNSEIPTVDATPTDGSSNAVSSNGVFDELALKQDFATATTGAVISFAVPQVYNSVASPTSSNITNDLTGARIGVVQKIFHNSGSAPTFPAGWVRLGTGSYVNSTLNIIYCEWVSGSRVEYWITQ